MNRSILVVFASRRGSTEEVASVIATDLREGGQMVDLRPVQEVAALDAYAAVVLGAPLYDGAWHPDAQAFLTRHQAALARCPVAIFTLGPLVPGEAALNNSHRQIDLQLKHHSWLVPKAIGVFGGRYDPAKFSFIGRMLNGTAAKDLRDWEAIHAWAQSLPARFATQV